MRLVVSVWDRNAEREHTRKEERKKEIKKEKGVEEKEEPSKSRTEPSGMPGVAPQLFHLFPSLFLSLLALWSLECDRDGDGGPLTEG
ncbi:hypothetical protein M0802_009566 [Mischocyttarus mexicanus]|nr:hypothetical protein M0802_009566 [Mischocyttarus mexicanus]